MTKLKTDFTLEEVKNIWAYYRKNSRYPLSERVSRTAKQLHHRHPDISYMSFYKYLTREIGKQLR